MSRGAGEQNLRAVWPGLFAVAMGLMAVLPTLPLYIEERFGIEDPAELRWRSAIVFGIAPFTAALVGPLWGGLGDRVGRKPMVVRAMGAIALVTAWMPFARTTTELTGLRLLQGAFAGYIAPAMALVSSSVPEERQGRAIARMQLALALGTLAGPAIGAEVARAFGRGSVFFMCSGLAAVATGIAWRFTREDRSGLEPRAAGTSWVRDLVGQSLGMLGNRVFVALLVLVFLLRFGQNMVEPFVALFVRGLGPLSWVGGEDLQGATDRTTAVAFGVLAVAQVLVTPLWGRLADRAGPLLCLAVAALALAGVLAATSWVESPPAFLAWRGCAALFMAGTMTLAYAAATKRVQPARRGIAFSMVQSFTQLGLSLGPLCGAVWVAAGPAGSGLAIGEEPSIGDAAALEPLRELFRLAAASTVLAGLGMLWLRLSKRARFETQAVTPVPDEKA